MHPLKIASVLNDSYYFQSPITMEICPTAPTGLGFGLEAQSCVHYGEKYIKINVHDCLYSVLIIVSTVQTGRNRMQPSAHVCVPENIPHCAYTEISQN